MKQPFSDHTDEASAGSDAEKKLRRQDQPHLLDLKHTNRKVTLALIAGAAIVFVLAGWVVWERKRTEEAGLAAQNARDDAYRTRLNLQTNTDATFGFISEQKLIPEFLLWLEDTPAISERFNSTLSSMLKRSTYMQVNEKKEWWNKLESGITKEETRQLLERLAAEAAERVRREIDIHVSIHDREGSPIPMTNGLYSLKTGEQVTISVEDVYNPYQLNVEFSYATSHEGMIKEVSQNGASYIAPALSKSHDTVTINVIDTEFNRIIKQRMLLIRTFE